MNAIPKPKLCEQNWLDMTPVNGGRLCGKCDKNIVDFSKMKWDEIEKRQQAQNNSICGMYTPKQLAYWGKEVPQKNYSKHIGSAALLISLVAPNTSFSQNNSANILDNKNVIRGMVTTNSIPKNITEPVIGATIELLIDQRNVGGAVTNLGGSYELDISKFVDTIDCIVLKFSSLGYHTVMVDLEISDNILPTTNVLLREDPNSGMSHFSVAMPSAKQRLKWKLKKWFRSKHD